MSEPCEHDYRYLGHRYWVNDRPVPGTGATDVHYFDAFFCGRCLDIQLKPIDVVQAGSYQARRDGSSPVPVEHAAELRRRFGHRW